MPEELKQIEIAAIQADAGVQVRTCIHEETVAAYHERMVAGDAFPPIVVFDDGQMLWLADGFHRMEAAKRARRPSIATRLKTGTRDDAAWYALGANRANGLPMSTADKVRAVKQALLMRPEASNNAIAKHIGVSDHTVAKYRNELVSGSQIANLTQTRGADGKQYPARRERDNDPPPPPPSIAVNADVPPPPPPAPQSAAPREIPPPPRTETPAPPAQTDAPQDRVGNVLTDPRLIEAFRRDAELVELCSAVSRVKSTVLNACKAGDPLFAHVNTGAFEADANNMRRAIANTRPYAVCPYCRNGPKRTSCKACHQRGWTNEMIYKQAPEEKR